jgi:hypothetical protein
VIIPDWAGYLYFRAAFGEAIDPRLHTLDWLDQRILSGEALFWRTERAAIVAEPRVYPTGKRDLHGLIAAGDIDDIADILIPMAEHYARSVGCIGAVIESRPGWARRLKGKGYATYQVALRKELV